MKIKPMEKFELPFDLQTYNEFWLYVHKDDKFSYSFYTVERFTGATNWEEYWNSINSNHKVNYKKIFDDFVFMKKIEQGLKK